jgi:hypothetical protein
MSQVTDLDTIGQVEIDLVLTFQAHFLQIIAAISSDDFFLFVSLKYTI